MKLNYFRVIVCKSPDAKSGKVAGRFSKLEVAIAECKKANKKFDARPDLDAKNYKYQCFKVLDKDGKVIYDK